MFVPNAFYLEPFVCMVVFNVCLMIVVNSKTKFNYLAFYHCHRNPRRIPKLDGILEQAKLHLTHERQFDEKQSKSVQLARVMYMLGESKEEVEKELNIAIGAGDDVTLAYHFAALYYEQTSQPDKALECCEKTLEIVGKDWFHGAIICRCKQRLHSQ